MRKLIVTAFALLLSVSSACADSTINALTAAATQTGCEAVPEYQSSNPAVRTTTGAIADLVAGAGALNVMNPPCGSGATAAVGNGQMYFDGAMASGSSTLSTKQPLSTATESSTTVTLTFTDPLTLGGVPGANAAPPFYANWTVGGSITVAGVNVSGYNGTFTITAIPTANTLQYTTTSGLSSGTGGTAYTSAPFAAGDVGKIICVQDAASASGQACGTISTFTDAEDVVLSFSNAAGQAIAPVQFIYGTSDQSAIASDFSTSVLPNGGEVYFPCGIYVMTAEIDPPLTGSWRLQGAADGEVGTRYSSFGHGTGRPCAMLAWLTTSAASASSAFYFGKGMAVGTDAGSVNFQTQHISIYNLAFQGGAGWASDGGGSGNAMNGIRFVGTNQTFMRNVSVNNFNGDCVQVETGWQGILIEDLSLFKCSAWCINTISAQGAVYIENYLQNCGATSSTGGLKMAPSPIVSGFTHAGTTVIGNTIQGNNGVDIRLGLGLVTGNYFDLSDTVFTMSDSGQDAALASFTNNYCYSGCPQVSFEASGGTALPAANALGTLAHQPPVLVTDATLCTNGTTYTGGGSTHCLVQSDGTNWKETGMGAY